MPIRQGSQVVKVFNSGLLVYLYDQANAATIRESGVNLIEPQGTAFGRLARTGTLVVYELPQDDPLHVDVCTGTPLTEGERSKLRWLAPQKAPLAVPSGALCIHSADSIPIGDDAPASKGAVATVPPGDYLLTLYRVNPDQLSVEGIRHRGPREVILLEPCPIDPESAPTAPLPFIAEAARAPWAGAWSVDGLRFLGQVVDGNGTLVTNLDREAAKRLGLAWGTALEVRAGRTTVTAIFLGDNGFDEYLLYRGESVKSPHPHLMGACWWNHENALTDVLVVRGETKFKLRPKTQVEVRVLPDPIDRRDESWVGNWSLAGTAVRGSVLHHYAVWGGPHCTFTLDASALEAIGASPGDLLVVRIGASEHRARWFEDEIAMRGAKSTRKSGELCAVLVPHWYRPDIALVTVRPVVDFMETPPDSFGFPVEIGMDVVVSRPGA